MGETNLSRKERLVRKIFHVLYSFTAFICTISVSSRHFINFTTKLCTNIISFTADVELLNICQVRVSKKQEKCRRELDLVKYTEKI